MAAWPQPCRSSRCVLCTKYCVHGVCSCVQRAIVLLSRAADQQGLAQMLVKKEFENARLREQVDPLLQELQALQGAAPAKAAKRIGIQSQLFGTFFRPTRAVAVRQSGWAK